jgi:hypothetical protein
MTRGRALCGWDFGSDALTGASSGAAGGSVHSSSFSCLRAAALII